MYLYKKYIWSHITYLSTRNQYNQSKIYLRHSIVSFFVLFYTRELLLCENIFFSLARFKSLSDADAAMLLLAGAQIKTDYNLKKHIDQGNLLARRGFYVMHISLRASIFLLCWRKKKHSAKHEGVAFTLHHIWNDFVPCLCVCVRHCRPTLRCENGCELARRQSWFSFGRVFWTSLYV